MINTHSCSHVGVSETTERKVIHRFGVYVARVGIALLGKQNMTEEQIQNCHNDPFHWEYYDNYAEGKGNTPEDAIKSMEKDIQKTADSLFA